jgi:glycosyltransferase involved in cell wall biosynthesis
VFRLDSINCKILKLVLVTTVPETFATILKGQPKWLAKYMHVECVTSQGSEFDKISEFENVTLHCVKMTRGISPFKDLVSIFQMWRILRVSKPDAVHSYTPKAGMITMFAALLAGVPIRIHTFTGLIFPSSTGVKRKILLLMDRLICLTATHVIPEGEGVKRDLIQHKVTYKPMAVIGHGNVAGIDTQYYSPESQKSKSPDGFKGFVFCFVGRLNLDKGIQELISAFLVLPNEPRLVLVGKLDATAPITSQTLEAIHAHPRIRCTGFLDDIRPVLACSNALVLPSYREGFPNVILQAGAMALPVIATDINGCNEVVENDFNGWLVTPRDVESLKKRMEYVMFLSDQQLATIGRNARERIVERFERRTYLQKLLNFYKESAK